MNREILFRGKRKDNGEWVYGDFCRPCNIVFEAIGYDAVLGQSDVPVIHDYAVIPETVGQYTGLVDKNDKKIFEGDVVKSSDGTNCIVEWDKENARFLGFTIGKERYIAYVGRELQSKIIGNIHDNPELLEVHND